MARTYQISSKAGADYGIYTADSPAEALSKLHTDAGYSVSVRGGELVFESDEDATLCGGVDDWTIRELTETAIEISHSGYGDTSRFASVEDAQAAIRACGYMATLRETSDGVYNEDDEKVGERIPVLEAPEPFASEERS